MKKRILLILIFIATTQFLFAQAGPCNETLNGMTTIVISSSQLMDNAGAQASPGNVLVCGGSTLTYNAMIQKDFYIQNGATLILKSAQIARIFLESGATLQFDTAGAVFNSTIINGITYDSTNVTFIDTNQINIPSGAVYWNHCFGNTFNYTVFTPAAPCAPLSLVDNTPTTVLKLSFQNPVQDAIRLNEVLINQTAMIQLLDLSGRVISRAKDVTRQLDVSNLQTGIYFIQLQLNSGEILSRKFYKD
jgi:hypothetical protein